jgi:hypothetical protein
MQVGAGQTGFDELLDLGGGGIGHGGNLVIWNIGNR